MGRAPDVVRSRFATAYGLFVFPARFQGRLTVSRLLLLSAGLAVGFGLNVFVRETYRSRSGSLSQEQQSAHEALHDSDDAESHSRSRESPLAVTVASTVSWVRRLLITTTALFALSLVVDSRRSTVKGIFEAAVLSSVVSVLAVSLLTLFAWFTQSIPKEPTLNLMGKHDGVHELLERVQLRSIWWALVAAALLSRLWQRPIAQTSGVLLVVVLGWSLLSGSSH